VITTAYVPAGVFVVVAMVTTDVPDPLNDVGEKGAVVAAGSPVTLITTKSENPLRAEIVFVYFDEAPATMVVVPGVVERVKSVTIRFTVVLFVKLPLDPETVRT
jgi:hypothetical protein